MPFFINRNFSALMKRLANLEEHVLYSMSLRNFYFFFKVELLQNSGSFFHLTVCGGRVRCIIINKMQYHTGISFNV